MMKLRGKDSTPRAIHPTTCQRCPHPIEKGAAMYLRREGWVHAACPAPAGAR